MPALYRDVDDALRNLGFTIEPKRGKGSHRVVHNAGKFITTLKFHGTNKAMLNSHINALARAIKLALPEFDESAWIAKLTGRPQASGEG
jgi:hypothetical protein